MRFDTTPQAAAIQERIFRQMSPSQRFKLALEMSESVRKVALAGLHSRRPELNAEEQSRELLRIMCGFAPRCDPGSSIVAFGDCPGTRRSALHVDGIGG